MPRVGPVSIQLGNSSIRIMVAMKTSRFTARETNVIWSKGLKNSCPEGFCFFFKIGKKWISSERNTLHKVWAITEGEYPV